jgi:hypothetical protein
MATLDNANPTILSASQLPTRQKKAEPRRGPESKYDDIIFAKPSYLSGPFAGPASAAWSKVDDQHDEFSSEAIDEQEIYGICPQSHLSHLFGEFATSTSSCPVTLRLELHEYPHVTRVT